MSSPGSLPPSLGWENLRAESSFVTGVPFGGGSPSQTSVCLYVLFLFENRSDVLRNPSCLESVSGTSWPRGRGASPLPEGAARAVEASALGQRQGQPVLEPAHADGRGAPDGARHGHQLPRPAHQGPRALCPLLDGGRNWGWAERKRGAVRGLRKRVWVGEMGSSRANSRKQQPSRTGLLEPHIGARRGRSPAQGGTGSPHGSLLTCPPTPQLSRRAPGPGVLVPLV